MLAWPTCANAAFLSLSFWWKVLAVRRKPCGPPASGRPAAAVPEWLLMSLLPAAGLRALPEAAVGGGPWRWPRVGGPGGAPGPWRVVGVGALSGRRAAGPMRRARPRDRARTSAGAEGVKNPRLQTRTPRHLHLKYKMKFGHLIDHLTILLFLQLRSKCVGI